MAQKKEAIEAVMDMFQQGAEVLASAVGELFPLCEAAAPVLRLALDNVHSKEVFYVKEQFLTVRNKLDVLSHAAGGHRLRDQEGETGLSVLRCGGEHQEPVQEIHGHPGGETAVQGSEDEAVPGALC